MKNGCLMVQGTTSDAGKSTLVAGLARVLHRRGARLAPFKPQNMALNSAVTEDGGEIGRAQALQAQACGLAPHTDMNPVLLKPASDTGAQVIIHGKAIGNMQALDYHHYKNTAKAAVLDSFARLQQQYGFVLVEGAGSPAEINLRTNDIANMGFAEAVDCPVIIVADIDKGGVFAHLVGTLELLSASEQARVVGFVINRFRGDIALLQPGLDWLTARTGKPVLGVIPYLHDFHLDAEDAIASAQRLVHSALKVVVPVLPRISNHTDVDALRLHPSVNLQFVSPREPIPACDLIILPGSKNVRADLALLKEHQWHSQLQRHLRYGGKLMGICGGLQMLGHWVHDPQGIEAEPGSESGFGLLDLTTELQPHKQLHNRQGKLQLGTRQGVFSGYEIHCGISFGSALAHPWLWLDAPSVAQTDNILAAENRQAEGASSSDGQVIATYMHGVFDQPEALQAILHWAGLPAADNAPVSVNALREQALNRLTDTLEAHLNSTWLAQLSAQAMPQGAQAIAAEPRA